jgi:hypothetical protein
MTHRLTYESLSLLLSDLGFNPGETTKHNQRVWQHPKSGCTLVLPSNKVNESPRQADVLSIKAQLDFQGHLDADAFEAFIAEGHLPARR